MNPVGNCHGIVNSIIGIDVSDRTQIERDRIACNNRICSTTCERHTVAANRSYVKGRIKYQIRIQYISDLHQWCCTLRHCSYQTVSNIFTGNYLTVIVRGIANTGRDYLFCKGRRRNDKAIVIRRSAAAFHTLISL